MLSNNFKDLKSNEAPKPILFCPSYITHDRLNTSALMIGNHEFDIN